MYCCRPRLFEQYRCSDVGRVLERNLGLVVPSPNVGDNGSFSQVRLVRGRVSSCTAVRVERRFSGGFPQLKRRSSHGTWKSSWSVVPSPNGTTQESNHLNSVGRGSANSCFAVGEYPKKEGSKYVGKTLIESWNGKQWTIAVSSDETRTLLLSGISCSSSNTCQTLALGIVGTGGIETLIESWNGSGWKREATP